MTFFEENEGTLDRTSGNGVLSFVNETKSPPTTPTTMSNNEAKITGRKALNGDSRNKNLGRANKRRANKATRRAGKVAL